MNKDFTKLSLSFALIAFMMIGVPILFGAFQEDGESYCKKSILIPCLKERFYNE
tara:strand:- start:423 stop:584 length:162 start_codon:yes stop_codon:yes gene_type:complete